MKTPFELFGVECGPGWKGIVNPLFEAVEKHNEEHPDSEIAVLQVKEKFGGLRFYVSEGTPELYEKIREAEEASWLTCEECGSTEDVVHSTGWVYTRCRKCMAKILEDRPFTLILEDVRPEELP